MVQHGMDAGDLHGMVTSWRKFQDPTQPNLIFVGTEQGLWISLDNAATFQQFKNGYPSVSTYDLAIQERENDLVIATFGRALYILDDIGGL